MRRPRLRISAARGCTPPICDDIRPWRAPMARRSPTPPGAWRGRPRLPHWATTAGPPGSPRSTLELDRATCPPPIRGREAARAVVQVEKPRRIAPEDLVLVGCRDREPVYDADMLPGIDRHRAVIGAEHDTVDAEHLHRLTHVRRPEAHGVDIQPGEIIARPLL